jgi:hypothetical protein
MFNLGKVVVTRGVMASIPLSETYDALGRHSNGDWGELPCEDKIMNENAVKNGNDRILSKYKSEDGIYFYIITEWDRSYTTVLLTDEY